MNVPVFSWYRCRECRLLDIVASVKQWLMQECVNHCHKRTRWFLDDAVRKTYDYLFTCEECRQHTIKRQNPACYVVRYCTQCKRRTEHA